jgi:hypothetical protein
MKTATVQPNQKYALTAARILVHYMINGGFLGAGGEANRDNNYILDHVARLRDIPVHVVHGRYDRVCHLYQAEALVRALRNAGNNAVNYFITTAGHSSFEPETDTRLRTIMNELPPMTPPETVSYNRRTRTMLQAGSLHVLLGYNRGDYRWHRMVARYTVGPGFEGSKDGLQDSDWARLELDGTIPELVAPLPILTVLPPPGATIAVAGYNQDRAQVLMADLSCHVTGTALAGGKLFIAHDCDATRGTSGGPLLIQRGSGWAIIGINIGAAVGANLAVPATAFAN